MWTIHIRERRQNDQKFGGKMVMKTVNIKGKEYVEVNERVKYFIKRPDRKSVV